jgi:outer membrane protein assembly factor BamB
MLYQHSVAADRDPWKSPQLLALKEKLRASPANESLRTEIRRLDLEFRQRYFRRLSLNQTGGWLLVGGTAAMLIAARSGLKLTARPHLPKRKADNAARSLQVTARSRWSVAAVGAVVVVGLAALVFTARTPLPDSASELDKLLGRASPSEAAADLPSLAEFRANWPRFRGPDGGGAAVPSVGLSFNFDEKSGAVVAWKSPVPASGFSSPIVWSNRVFISGGDAKKREVFCYDATGGQLLWQRAIENVPGSPAKPPEIPDATGYAAATMATDGRHAFVIFANGDLAALTMDGAPTWSKHLGVPKNAYGYATSLALWPGKLIVQFDQGETEPANSKLLALDAASGRLLWERSRPVSASWSSPIIVEGSGKIQIITVGLPWVIAYSLADGNELWRAELLEGEITPSPIFAGGLVIVVNPTGKLIALRPDGVGDVSKSHVAWTVEESVPDVTSPVGNGELVFTVTSMGLVTCFNVNDGKKVWDKDLEMEVQSSPAIAGNQLFLLSTKGDAVMLEAGRAFKGVTRRKLEDAFHASPAFANGRMYLRGATNLFCIGPAGDKLAKQK